jgi:hypothetical protein
MELNLVLAIVNGLTTVGLIALILMDGSNGILNTLWGVVRKMMKGK